MSRCFSNAPPATAPTPAVEVAPAQPQPRPEPRPPVASPPQGTYQERLARVMALRKETTPEAIAELVAALGDSESNIRWLAASVLQGIGGEHVIAALKAFIPGAPSEAAREEAAKLLDKLTEG